jgi:carbonic anhydrase
VSNKTSDEKALDQTVSPQVAPTKEAIHDLTRRDFLAASGAVVVAAVGGTAALGVGGKAIAGTVPSLDQASKINKGTHMSKVLNEVLSANARYAEGFGNKGNLPMPPGRRFAVLTCMDARLDPAKFAGLAEGDAHVIRNAGGRASDDAIRSLVISYKLLGTREWFIIHHTDCGMLTFTNEIMTNLLSKSLKTSSVDATGWHDSGKGPGSDEGKYINWLTISDNAKSVVEDVTRVRNHPLVPADIPIYGYIYDCKTGRLTEIRKATAAGAAG